MKTAHIHAGVVGSLLISLTSPGPACARQMHPEAGRLLERVEAAAHLDPEWAKKSLYIVEWSPAELTPVNLFVHVQRLIRADTASIAPADLSRTRLRSAQEVWVERRGTEIEKAILLLAGMRELGLPARPLVVCNDIERAPESPSEGIARDAVLIEVELPKTTLGERYGGRQILDPGCPRCGFGELRMVFYGRDAIGLEDGKPTRTRLAVPGADANRIEHRAIVDFSPPRRLGPPVTPGGFSSLDTAGVVPSMDFSVDQEIVLTGALRGRRIPTMKAVPLSLGGIRLGPKIKDPPDLMRGEGKSGQMCRRPDSQGTYRIADAVVDPTFLLADSTATDSLRLPFGFEVVTILTVPLQPSWRLIDLPVPIGFERPGLSFHLSVETAADRYVRSLHLRVEKTMFVGDETKDFRDLARVVRGCSGRMGRIRP